MFNSPENTSYRPSSPEIAGTDDIFLGSPEADNLTESYENPHEVNRFTGDIGAINFAPVATAVNGIRRYILECRLELVEGKIDRKTESDDVIKSSTEGARLIRGFKSQPEDPADTPISATERMASRWRQGQVTRVERKRQERWRLQQSLGETPTERPIPSARARSTPQYITSMDYRDSLRNKWPQPSVDGTSHQEPDPDFGITTGHRQRMKEPERRARHAARRKDRSLRRSTNRINARLDRGETGQALPARARTRKIRRLDEKRSRIETKIQNL